MKSSLRVFRFVVPLVFFMVAMFTASATPPDREFYEIRTYRYVNKMQEDRLDQYLQHALLPALHRIGIRHIGVFKPWGNDTLQEHQTILLIPYKSAEEILKSVTKLENDKQYLAAGTDFLDATYKTPPYSRYESILLKAFTDMPLSKVPSMKSKKEDRVYELRSYESATEKIFRNKVDMFNKGGEIILFNRLGFNAVFYAEAIIGSHLPNLMYMTTFDNKEARDEHWKTFVNDAEWKKLSSMPEYQNNVSKIDITFLQATPYSDL